MTRGLVTALAALVALATPALGAEPAGPVTFGDMPFGLTLEEARKALPNAAWLAPGRSVDMATAAAGASFGGRPASVSVIHRRYHQSLEFQSLPFKATIAQCLGSAGVWFKAASAAGPLRAPPPMRATQPTQTQWQTSRIEGNLILTPVAIGGGITTFGEVYDVGEGVTALLDGRRGPQTPWALTRWARTPPKSMSMVAVREPTSVGEIQVEANADWSGKTCQLAMSATRTLPLPPPETFVATLEKTLSRGTIAQRHAAVSKLPAGWAERGPLSRSVRCRLDRRSGETDACVFAPEAEPLAVAENQAILTLANYHRFDMAGVDIDEPVAMQVDFTVTLEARDQRTLDFLDALRTEKPMLRRIMAPSPDYVFRMYPAPALEREVEADIRLTCQVQSDGSILCGNPRDLHPAAKPEFAPAFFYAAQKLSQFYRYAPERLDGSPSAGVVMELQTLFRLE